MYIFIYIGISVRRFNAIQRFDSVRRFTSIRQVIDAAVPATHSARTLAQQSAAALRRSTAALRRFGLCCVADSSDLYTSKYIIK